MLDLSSCGALIHCAEPLDRGEAVVIRAAGHAISAVVARLNADRFGVRFRVALSETLIGAILDAPPADAGSSARGARAAPREKERPGAASTSSQRMLRHGEAQAAATGRRQSASSSSLRAPGTCASTAQGSAPATVPILADPRNT